MENNTKIKVVDSIMGQGKTTWAIDFMKENISMDNFLYITPFIDEVKRVREEVKHVTEPKAVRGSKLNHIRELTSEGRSIISTHSLLSRFDLDIQDNIELGRYTLILDEVADVVHQHEFNTEADKRDFFQYYAKVSEEGYVVWDEEAHPVQEYSRGSKFYNEMILCLNKNLVELNDKLVMWELPIEVFKKFKEVYILTYMFEGSVQKPYFDLYNIEYEYLSVKQGKLTPYEKTSKEVKQELKQLINIVHNETLNDIGNDNYALSSTWFKKNIKKSGQTNAYVSRLKKNLVNFFKQYTDSSSDTNMWSTFMDYQPRLKGSGYGIASKHHVPFNIRATNKYQHKKALAYILNVFPHTSLTMYFNNRQGLDEVNIDNDRFALSTLIQWIWRSRIRRQDLDHESRQVDLYIPSSRMRGILESWLESD